MRAGRAKKISRKKNGFSNRQKTTTFIPPLTKRFGAIKNPAKAVLVGETPAFFGGSWHPAKPHAFPDAKNNLGFIDGHVSSTKIYWDGLDHSEPRNYEPPSGYQYDWDGE